MAYEMIGQFVANPFILYPLLIWTVAWKGLGLWHSAQEGKNWWFIAMLLLNTAGILPIVYLIWFKEKAKPKRKRRK